jgi:hypothetical protein
VQYVPRPHFTPFHAREERWALLVCHRRAGKTVAAVNELIARALHTQKEHARYAYLAPFREQAKRIAWDYLLRYTEGFRRSASITELNVTLVNGSRITLHGADNADNLRGQYWDGIVVDEPASMRQSVFTEVIRPALADRIGWAVWIGTAAGKNEFWEMYEIARRSLGGPAGWYFMDLKASTSGILPQSELDDARLVMDEDTYAQEFENDFGAAIKGSIYGKAVKQAEAESRIVPTLPFAADIPTHTCWDIGFSDFCVVWFFQIIGKVPSFLDCLAVRGHDVHDVASLVEDKKLQHGFKPGYHYLPRDAWADTFQTGRSTVEQLLARGIRARAVPSLSVQDGIQATRQMLRVALFDGTRCERALEALRQYQYEYDEAKQTFRSKPRHDWCSDYADALRVGALGYQEDYGKAPAYVPPKFLPKPKISDGIQLEKLWDTVKRPTGRWSNRI